VWAGTATAAATRGLLGKSELPTLYCADVDTAPRNGVCGGTDCPARCCPAGQQCFRQDVHTHRCMADNDLVSAPVFDQVQLAIAHNVCGCLHGGAYNAIAGPILYFMSAPVGPWT
jgi:hypothetical protein